jgi:CheY-like chemotaxis protein
MSNVCEMRAPTLQTAGPRRQMRGRILLGGAAMGATLARTGHRASTAGDAEGLLNALEQHCFDLVLVDLQAPEIDAIATVKLYRYIARGEPQPPIVAVTERRSAKDIADCRDAGIETCVPLADAVRVMAALSTREAATGPGRPAAGAPADTAMPPRAGAVHRAAFGRLVPVD